MAMSHRVDCWKKDLSPEIDPDFSSLIGALRLRSVSQLSEHLIPEHTPISNQGNLGSCVANSSTDSLEILLGNESNKVIQLSRLMTYWIARELDGTTNQDQGTFIRSAFTQMAKFGVAPEALWPYDESKVFVSPSIEALEAGNSNLVKSVYRISSTGAARLSDIETAIRANHPVVFGTTVGSDFENWTKGSPALRRETNPEGGHAILCTGIRYNTSTNKPEFYIRNSWGPDWGDDGHIWLADDYMTWDQTTDLWVPTLMPALVV